jgi:hypothetical protein
VGGGGGRGGKRLHHVSENKDFKEILRCNYFVRTGLYALVVSIGVAAVTGCADGLYAINLPFSGKR